jgi:hypothetical protein
MCLKTKTGKKTKKWDFGGVLRGFEHQMSCFEHFMALTSTLI